MFVLTLSVTILPSVVHGDLLPSTGNTPLTQWIPSGPAADKIFFTFYDSDTTELNQICAGQVSSCVPSIDITDVPLPGADLVSGGCSTNCADTDPRFWVTTPTIQIGELEAEFNHASSLWGVTFCNGRDNVVDGVTQCYDGLGGTPVTASCPNVPAPHTGDCTWAALNIRQGIASLINKVKFTLADVGAIGPNAAVLDNFLAPASSALHSGSEFTTAGHDVSPNIPGHVCNGAAADCNFVGPYCVTPGDTGSLSNVPGTQAVDCSTSGAIHLGGVCSWDVLRGFNPSQPCLSAFHYFEDPVDSLGFNLPGGRDFCAAADHFIAAGLATGKDATTCELTGESSQLTNPSVPVIFKGRNSLGRHNLSIGLSAAICELIASGASTCPAAQEQLLIIGLGTAHAQVFRTGCTTLAVGGTCATVGPNTPQNAGSSFTQSWNIYAGGFFFTSPAPNAQFGEYDSSLASNYCGFDSAGNPLVPGSPGTGSPGEESPNYPYVCNHRHDIYVEQSQFLGTPAAAEASLQIAMDMLGNHTFSIPIWTPSVQYPFVKGWTGVNNAAGIGTAQGNAWSLLNMWNPNPAIAGPTIRWGQKDATDSLNPYTEDTVVDGDLTYAISTPGPIWDGLLAFNPAIPTAVDGGVTGWMANFYRLETHATQPAECPASYTNSRGTFNVGACVKIILRGDIPWHNIISDCATPTSTCLGSHVVTASDVKFSFLSLNATGGLYTSSTANTIDVVYNPNQLPASAYSSVGGANGGGISETLFLYLHNFNAWALSDIIGVPILPHDIWVQQTAPRQANGVFAPCITIDTPSCLADPARLGGAQSDPVKNNLFIGSGPWVCASGDLAASGTVIGGGCTSSGSQAIPFGGSAIFRRFSKGANGLDPNFAYFKSNEKFAQYLWAAYTPATNAPGNAASVADILSAVNSCKASATAVGGVVSYQACTHWNNPSAGIGPCLGPAGTPCLGVAAGGHGSLPNNPGPITTQIQQWIGRGQWNFGASSYAAGVHGAQAIPQTLYADGNSEGSFSIAASPTSVSTTAGTIANVAVSVSLSGGPDNNFTGTVPVTLTTVQSSGLTANLGTTSVTLSPGSPTASTTLQVSAATAGTYIVYVKAFVNAAPPTYPAVTVKITVTVT